MAMVCRLYHVAAAAGGTATATTSQLGLSKKCSRRFYFPRPRPSSMPLHPMCCMQTEAESSIATSAQNQEQEEKQGTELKSSLSSLDSYFTKLQATSSSNEVKQEAQISPSPSSYNSQGLSSLNEYFNKMQPPVKEEAEAPKESLTEENVLSFLKEMEDTIDKRFPNNKEASTEASNPTILLKEAPKAARTFTNVVIGLNVAIFLFGLASPIQTPEMVEVPLPLLYGAKINVLIADGQWWRLITPMFLHDGLIHLGLGAWALLSFGPAVEYVYGSAGFCMIYFLGGIFGNLASFFHTPVPTVGGTGPIFALVAAWAVYVIQNRNMFGKELQAGVMSDVVQKLLVMSALHLALTDALPADNWTHVGATLVGTLFGVIATPKAVQLNVPVEDSDQYKMVMFGEAPDVQRLTIAFALCLGVYFCLYNFGVPASNELLFKALSHKNDPNFL